MIFPYSDGSTAAASLTIAAPVLQPTPPDTLPYTSARNLVYGDGMTLLVLLKDDKAKKNGRQVTRKLLPFVRTLKSDAIPRAHEFHGAATSSSSDAVLERWL